jgi:hypothetical protein
MFNPIKVVPLRVAERVGAWRASIFLKLTDREREATFHHRFIDPNPSAPSSQFHCDRRLAESPSFEPAAQGSTHQLDLLPGDQLLRLVVTPGAKVCYALRFVQVL